MHFSKEIKALFIITSLMLNNCFGLYKDLSHEKSVLIVNYNGGCRYCKTLIDYNNSIYSFIECSLSYDVRQRFSISRGKSNETFSYLIANDSSKTFILKTFPNQANEFFITQNKNGSNIIISALENLCLTNPISVNTQPYHISPSLNNMNLMFSSCSFNSQNLEQEFYFEKDAEIWFLKGKINLYYADTTTFVTAADINLINTHYPEYRFIIYGSNQPTFIPNSSSFDILLPVDENSYVIGNNFETIPFNTFHYCTYSTLPKSYASSYFLSPFSTRDRCQPNYTFNFDYYLEKLNRIEFKFYNITIGNYLNSSFLTNNSDIVFTNNTNGKIYKYNLAQSSFTSFNAELSFGNYSTSISIKSNINFESVFQGLNFSVNNCSYNTYNIPFREKINNVTFFIKNQDGNGSLTTSLFTSNTNIVFTRAANAQTYVYNVGSGNQSSFAVNLHHDTYTISSTTHSEWSRVTNSVTIADYNSTSFDIVLRENKAQATFNFLVSNLGNAATNSCVFELNSTISFTNGTKTTNYTVSSCTNTIVLQLHWGTWTLNSSLSQSAKDTMLINNGQSWYVGDNNNKSFTISLTKLDNYVNQYVIQINNGTSSNLNPYIFDCGNNYYMTYFRILSRHSNSLNAYLICKQLETNNVNQISTDWQWEPLYAFDRHDPNCGSGKAIQSFQFQYSSNVRIVMNCISIPTPLGTCTSDASNNSNIPFIGGTSNISSLHLTEFGLGNSYFNRFQFQNYSHFTTYYWKFTYCLLYNYTPYNISRYFISSSLESTTFKGLSGLNITCNSGEALILIAYIHNGSAHQNFYLCRSLNAGTYGNLNQRYTDGGGWNVGGWHWIYFERQTLDCGANGILNSLQLEFDDTTQQIRTRYLCYDYYNPTKRVLKSIENTPTCTANYDQIHLNGFTFGDGANFLNYTDIGGCSANFYVLLPLV